MVVRFSFERGKSCRYSTYTYSKQLGEFWREDEGLEGGAWPTPASPKSATAYGSRPVSRASTAKVLLCARYCWYHWYRSIPNMRYRYRL